ncbi:MAG: hypothetical protein ACYDBQ_12760, partial [Thermoplasmatota archaeon]
MQDRVSNPRLPSMALTALFVLSALAAITPLPAAAQTTTAAKLTQVLWMDTNQNGHLDTVRLTFDKNIDYCTVQPTDFQITLGDGTQELATNFLEVGDFSTASPPNSGPVPGNCWTPTASQLGTTITLQFKEGIDVDGGQTSPSSLPTITYSPDPVGLGTDLVDAAGLSPAVNPTCPQVTSTFTCTDNAVPRLMGAFARVGDTTIQAVFSEPVHEQGAANTVVPTAHDFCLTGGSGNTPLDYTKAPTFNSASSPSQRIVTLNIAFRTSVETAFSSSDFPMTLGVGGTCSTDASFTTKINDVMGTGFTQNNVATLQQATVDPAARPAIKAVHGNIGGTQLLVEFQGAVADDTGAALTLTGAGTAFSLAPCGTCAAVSINGASLLNRGPAGSDRALLNLDRALTALDFGGSSVSPATSQLRITAPTPPCTGCAGAKTPAGYGTSGSTAGATYLACTSPPATFLGVAGCGSSAPASVPPIPFTQDSSPPNYLSNPFVVSQGTACGYAQPAAIPLACAGGRTVGLETVDFQDASVPTPNPVPDGLLDGIRVTFNEAMANFGAPGEWCVQIPATGASGNVCLRLSAVVPCASATQAGCTSAGNQSLLMFAQGCGAPCAPLDTGTEFRVSHLASFGSTAATAADEAGNLLPPFQKWGTTDAAPPRLMRYSTLDYNHDGFLDSVQLVFSETIQDSTFNAADWSLDGGYAVNGFDSTCAGAPGAPALVGQDNCVRLTFTPKGTPSSPVSAADTGARMNLTYSRAHGAILDLSGLAFQSSVSTRLVPDGAQPVLMQALGTAGATKVRLVFSEPVGGSASGPAASNACQAAFSVLYTDLKYIDGGGPNDGASSLVGDCDSSISDRIVDLFTNRALTSNGDLSGANLDHICPMQTITDHPTLVTGDPPWAPPFNRVYVPADASCLAIGTAVPITMSFQTVDANHDGYLDAIRVTFSQSVSDGDGTKFAQVLRIHPGKATTIPCTPASGSSPGTCPALSDLVYADEDGSGSITPGDFRYSGWPGGCA